ncbi:DgyrCDS9333 [Dimorphilus gyrociliatus]|uniref:DgyrCDS9333 n=1 Tax=Dimorphilus gyrociliatus TaxID=2664684 RepID=A0A7I8VYD8_9ANNE|nr:DgyrCDS9333 [Dimorphilus gyrociliatus]
MEKFVGKWELAENAGDMRSYLRHLNTSESDIEQFSSILTDIGKLCQQAVLEGDDDLLVTVIHDGEVLDEDHLKLGTNFEAKTHDGRDIIYSTTIDGGVLTIIESGAYEATTIMEVEGDALYSKLIAGKGDNSIVVERKYIRV